MKTTLYVPDIECDSCVRVINKVLQKRECVERLSIRKDSVDIMHDPNIISEKQLVMLIREKGFRADTSPFERKTFKERLKDFRENKHKYHIEYTLLKYAAAVLLLLIGIEVLAYFAFFKHKPDFIANYAWWILYTDIAVVSIGSAIWHIKSYKASVTSMIGMMIGMTFGMQTGMMIGTILAATNGLFVGGTTGMTLAVLVGWYNGKCCGIMGVMEGMMAGVMGGIMGGMIGTMFKVDHILWFMPFFMLFNIIIMWGLSYMLYEEVVEGNQKIKKEPIDFTTFFSYTLLATSLIIGIMVYGLKTGIASIGGI